MEKKIPDSLLKVELALGESVTAETLAELSNGKGDDDDDP
jgi:hypothetical protein